MQSYESLRHSSWECKYHVVFIPKSRRKVLCGQALDFRKNPRITVAGLCKEVLASAGLCVIERRVENCFDSGG